MASLQQIRNKADAKLLVFWDALMIRQEAYHLLHDNYFQFRLTNNVVDGVDSDFIFEHPDDQIWPDDVAFSFPDKIPFQLVCTPFGGGEIDHMRGFRLQVFVELLDGRRFTRWRELTDTRTRTSEGTYVGADPIIETSPWEEVIEPVSL